MRFRWACVPAWQGFARVGESFFENNIRHLERRRWFQVVSVECAPALHAAPPKPVNPGDC